MRRSSLDVITTKGTVSAFDDAQLGVRSKPARSSRRNKHFLELHANETLSNSSTDQHAWPLVLHGSKQRAGGKEIYGPCSSLGNLPPTLFELNENAGPPQVFAAILKFADGLIFVDPFIAL